VCCRLLRRQLGKAASSSAADYRTACRARSRAEFVAKLGTVCEEIDESEFWLDVLVRPHDSSDDEVPDEEVQRLQKESLELRAK
jgi:four helix bundle protein